ncbi:T9SS type A sorting domain-containing protein [Jiulongibacter sediminis]|uniref:T9SS type A sorting domain-containing protein n=1 Tax=Jiulongibacter sediminis TaxID=1605367 RepID=UPI0026F04FF0|nr:T9SS type A sorting domain-containing protein [Jiulongibacter sediminis]
MKTLLYLSLMLPICAAAQTITSYSEISIEDGTPLRVYTNPSNAFTRIEFWEDDAEQKQIDLLNGEGRILERLVKKVETPGLQITELDTREFSPGVYFIKVGDEMRKIVKY